MDAVPTTSPENTPRSPGLTDQQRRAVVTRDVSVLLSSGAGCGKTHVLTERYLSHLRHDGAEVGQIVAITFTERAARQMRARIRQAVLKHLRDAESEEDAERWARHLRGLETAPISTIHAFCATLLRQFAVEAGLDPTFDVLEDVLSVNLEAEALTASLQKLLTAQGTAGEDLRQLVLLFGWRPVNEAVRELLHAWDALGWKAWLETPATDVAAGWQQQARTVLLPRYLEYVLAARPKVSRLLPLLRRHPPLPGPLSESVGFLLDELPRLPQAEDAAAAVERLAEAAKVGKQGAKAWPDAEVYEQIKDAFKDFREDLRALKLERFSADPATLPAAVEVGQRFLRVAAEAQQTYHERKRRHGVVDFQDLLVLARDLLRDNAEARTRLQERYRFLLIDELQDTDPVQMELVESLCGAELTAGKLFAVGDASQSIYRFRGADVYLFQGLRQRMAHEGRLGLTINFRSQPALLDFTNALVGHRLAAYELLRAFHEQVNPGPCVEFLWSPCADEDDASQARSAEAEGIARRIAAMVDREELVVQRTPEGAGLRPVRRGDVVLLFRAMSNVHLYEAALRKHGLDYYLVGGRAFFAQQEIYDLLNLLRALENPQDEVSLAGTLRSPFCCLSDEVLFVLCRGWRAIDSHPVKSSLWLGLHEDGLLDRLPQDQREPVLRARRFLDRWRSLKDRLPIARLLGEVLADSGYDAAMQFEFLGDRKLANLWKLVDLARTFDRSGLFGLAEFIARLGDLVENQPREEQAATQPENADVVRLMTIHQAKGLEFPVVIIPDIDAAIGGGHPPVARWDARLGCVVRPPADAETPPFPDYGWGLWKVREDIEDWNESLRTLYVACTRAQDYLILSSALAPSFRPSSPWMLTLAERFDLFSGACLVPDLPPERTPAVRVPDVREAFTTGNTGNTLEEQGKREFEGTGHPSAGIPDSASPLSSPVSPVFPVVNIPVRRIGQRSFTVAELEACLHAPPFAGPGMFAVQFEAEDGSDRNHWPTRRERLESAQSPQDLLLRTVLQAWDFRDPQGWRPLLRRAAAHLGLVDESGVLERGLEWFVTTNTFAPLGRAEVCHRELAFLLPWPGKKIPAGLTHRPAVRGVIDCLWQDVRGGWHLVALRRRASPTRVDEFAKFLGTIPLSLTFWVHAVRQLFGAWPQEVTVCYLEEQGSVASNNVSELRKAKVLDLFRKALEATIAADDEERLRAVGRR
jgi:ATP-dependent helicase/nuclease subunit A